MIDPLLSVLMPYYNKAEFVVESVRSVLNCGYPNIEVILWDDGSTDKGIELVKANFSDPRLRIFENNVHLGHGGKVRQACLNEAQGEYITNIDCDDECMPGAFNEQIAWLQFYHGFGSCHGPVIHSKVVPWEKAEFNGIIEMGVPGYIMARHEKEWNVTADGYLTPDLRDLVQDDMFECEWEYSFMQTSGAVMRHSIVDRVGGYDCWLPYRGSMQDYDLCLRVIREAPTHWVNKVTSLIRKDEKASNDRWGFKNADEAYEWNKRTDGKPYDRNRAYIQEKYRHLIKRKLEPIPFFHTPGLLLSLCDDGYLNQFWPGMAIMYDGSRPSNGSVDVIYTSHYIKEDWTYNEVLTFLINMRDYLRVDGVMKLIVPKGHIETWDNWYGTVLEGLGFELRNQTLTPFNGGSYECEAIKRESTTQKMKP